ncbi:AbrB family transcriptional regulator [Candidatus Pelagibacter bacterium nBUS_32]|uniref:AbrB family transcriptional regulator n=1 Tax=Candidatus Pelagibacter bacterium nBUS_32 TaxID=3374192 RepID=UPI003EBB9F33
MIKQINQIFKIKFISVLIISFPSAIIAEYFNIPLAWFLGPMIITSIAALSGLKIIMPKIVLSFILIILGLHIGNYIDQNLFNQMFDWIWTSLIMLIYIIICILVVAKYLQKYAGYGEKASIFSAAPGALGPLMILAENEKTDLSQVATSHLIRLIIIITVIPFIIVNNTGSEILLLDNFDYMGQNHLKLILLIIASLFFIFVFDKIRVPAALLSGTLFASGLLQMTDVASYKLPDASINFCLLILGASVGCRFAEKTIKEIANNSLHSLVATIILVLLGFIAAYVATFFVDTNILTLILSFSPGGIYEVAVIAIAFDLEPDFVAFHHIIRLLFILFTVPVILKVLSKFKKLS